MTKNKLALALLLLSTNSFAGEYENNPANLQLQLQAQSQYQSQKQSQTGSTANSTNDIHISAPRIASSAIAPSVSQYSDCPVISPASKAASIFPISLSGTTGTTLNAFCIAMYFGETDVMHRIACSNSRDYHDANPAG